MDDDDDDDDDDDVDDDNNEDANLKTCESKSFLICAKRR